MSSRSIFAVDAVQVSATGLAARIVLDPLQPYLQDHRPGGTPLFGTVMSIEAMATLALRLAPGLHVRAVESIENYASFVLRGDTAPLLAGTAVRERTHEAEQFDCALTSAGAGDSTILHSRARVRLAAALEKPLARAPSSAPAGAREVTAREIYRVFFHGPAFRVIDTARWDGHRLSTSSSQGLPPCFAPPLGPPVAGPRLIEFALQTAGLFEIAANGRIMIPHFIRSIQRFSAREIDCGLTFQAVAASGADAASPQDLDVEVVDEAGNVHLRVLGYRTLPLPFAADLAGPAALQRCFL